MTFRQPQIKPLGKGRYELTKTYTYEWSVGDIRYRIKIPKGYQYDGASVPRWLWTITGFLPDGLNRAGALVHDFLYEHGGVLDRGTLKYKGSTGGWRIAKDNFSRLESDKMFKQIMIQAGVPRIKAYWAFIAVRVFGTRHWK